MKYAWVNLKTTNSFDFNGVIFSIFQIMCCILVSRQGLSETELKSILHITDQMWSVLYFAIEEFILERAALYG